MVNSKNVLLDPIYPFGVDLLSFLDIFSFFFFFQPFLDSQANGLNYCIERESGKESPPFARYSLSEYLGDSQQAVRSGLRNKLYTYLSAMYSGLNAVIIEFNSKALRWKEKHKTWGGNLERIKQTAEPHEQMVYWPVTFLLTAIQNIGKGGLVK